MLLLLLDNTDAYTPITESSPPAACRVVVVEFPTLTKTGTSTVLLIGDNPRLQFLTTCKVIAASLPGTPIDVGSSPPIFTISDAPRVHKILCRHGPNIGEMMVSLEGRYFAVGKYTVTFEGSPSLALDVSFAEDQKGKQTQFSSSVSVGPGGNDKRLALGETYKCEWNLKNSRSSFHLCRPCRAFCVECIPIADRHGSLIRSSSVDLKLFQISSGLFEFCNGVIAYEPSSTANSEIRAANSDLCSWTTGAIEI
ncbi:hypothetical protein BLNAU_18328 [Blattamonas nauphoetae]|uniref:Uncharacterized protein n=1 Tax=Blattamonas nauphoetae TaxID=2049346 RepID=A0ABQ9X4V8_9EUKA|nr:hypothetical protein BLNAU_18328 [Blattamonas nauphoetae]